MVPAPMDPMAGHAQRLTDNRNDFAQALEGNMHSVHGLIAGHSDRLAADRSALTQALESDLAKLVDARRDIDRALAGHIDQIATSSSSISDAIAADIEKVEQAFARQTGVIEERSTTMERALNVGVDNIRGALEKSALFVAGQLREKVLEVTNSLHEQAGIAFTDADRKIAERAEQTSAALMARAEDIAQTFETADQRLVARAVETAQTLAARAGDILRNFETADERMGVRIAESADALATRASDLSRIFETLEEQLTARIAHGSDALSARASEIGRIFDDADSRMVSRIAETSSSIGGHADQIVGAFAETERRVADRARMTGEELAGHAGEIERALNSADQRLASSAAAAAARVEGHIASAESRFANSADAMGQKLDQQITQAEGQLASRANVIAETFAAVGQHIGQSTNEAAKTIGANTRELNAMLASRSAELSKILDETARPLVDKFSQGGVELQRSMEEATERATAALHRENATLADAIASRTAETLAAVDGARSSLAGNVADLIDRMTASSAQLNKLIAKASENLGEVESRLAGSTQSFAVTTEKAAQTFASSARLVDSNTTRLTELSSSTLREVASIATRFDEHSRLLASASDLLGSAQSNLEHTLERQSSLDDLAVGLVKKSEDLERVMRSFETLVGQTLQNAEGKTLESADKIRVAISEVVEAATKRFADATDEMRRTAGSIKSELDLTRAELRKGVIEMPEEAKESTTAIRRAVSEQISALKELSEIVAKSGRTVDVSEPRNLRPTPAPRPAEPPLRRPAQPEQRAPQPPLASTGLRGPLEPGETALRPRGDARAPQQGGWVRDLLTGASEDDGARPAPVQPRATPVQRSPLHVVESLNSLSVDIARAIDHDASIELWNRYRRGERDVFTRRLYTLKGQQTFDEIRRKYQSEAEFRAAVDRYCDDFEKLLKDVSRNDRDNMISQTYLTSDTGKVYTMLAHASGRLR